MAKKYIGQPLVTVTPVTYPAATTLCAPTYYYLTANSVCTLIIGASIYQTGSTAVLNQAYITKCTVDSNNVIKSITC